MLKNNFGAAYTETGKGIHREKTAYGVKRGRHGWQVYQVKTGETVKILPTKLRAYYVATRYSGVDVSEVFNFGSGFFG